MKKVQEVYEDINKKNAHEIYIEALNAKTLGKEKDISKLADKNFKKRYNKNIVKRRNEMDNKKELFKKFHKEIDVITLEHNENMEKAQDLYWTGPFVDDKLEEDLHEEIDVNKLADEMIATGDEAYIYAFARDKQGAPVEKLLNAIIDLRKSNQKQSRPSHDDIPGM